MPDASETLEILVKARDAASKVIEDLNNSLEETSKVTKSASNNFGGFRSAVNETKSSIFGLKSAIAGLVAAFGTWKIYSFVKDATLMSARFTTLGVTLNELAIRAGYTKDQISEFEKGLRASGIAATETRTILTRMIQSQLDLNRATELGRVAQDAAVIGGLNSSETFERLLHAIQSNSVEILRTIGLNISFEQSYKKFARTLGVSVSQLTEAQKSQSRFNAVIEGGALIAGAYESAMTTAGKQLLSFKRYYDDFKVEVGKSFEIALSEIVMGATAAMKEFTAAIQDPGFQKELTDFGKILAVDIRNAFQWVIENKSSIITAIREIVRSMGDAVTSLTFLLNLLTTSQEDITNQQRESFQRLSSTLAAYVSERESLLQKMKDMESGGIEGSVEKFLDFGKSERRLRELNALIEKYSKLARGMDDALRKPRQASAEIYSRAEGVITNFGNALSRVVKQEEKLGPLTSTLFASSLKRALADVNLELAKTESLYSKNLISLQEYYNKRVALAKKSFEEEKKYLSGEISRETDADKKLKLQDQLYEKEKKFNADSIKLNDERLSAEKDLTQKRFEIQARLEQTRIDIAKQATDKMTDVFVLEQEELRSRQEKEISDLEDQKATLGQIEEAHRLHQLQRDQQIAEQRTKAINTVYEGVKYSLENLNNAFGDLYEASGNKAKEWFYAQKAIAIAQTVISTYQAAQEAYKAFAAWPPLAIAAAATAVAAGLARVAAIRSQSLAEGGEVKGYSPTKKSDNVRINATAGEYMQPVPAVEKYGLPFMESIRNLTFPVEIAKRIIGARYAKMPSPRFSYATGGQVSSSGVIQPNLVINMNNKTGEKLNVRQEETRYDGKDLIADIVIEKYMTSRGYRQAFARR